MKEQIAIYRKQLLVANTVDCNRHLKKYRIKNFFCYWILSSHFTRNIKFTLSYIISSQFTATYVEGVVVSCKQLLLVANNYCWLQKYHAVANKCWLHKTYAGCKKTNAANTVIASCKNNCHLLKLLIVRNI